MNTPSKKKLDSVTLLGIDCVDFDRLKLAADICQEHFDFAEVKLLTSLPVNDPAAVHIPPLTSIEAYSKFAIESLDDYVSTPHVLIIQYDGFILNPDAWTDDFLLYDYIGAPWFLEEWAFRFGFKEEDLGKLIVGNGGFCLRSKKLLSLSAKFAHEGKFAEYHPEDFVLCHYHRKLFEAEGMKFAPVEVAKKFSFEGDHDVWNGELGFHGLRWTDISRWNSTRPDIEIDREKNTIKRKTIG